MSIILTLESFVTGTKQSSLVDEYAIDEVIEQAAAAGKSFETATQLADALVDRELITRWQAEKLLQGKYRGFCLGRYRLLELLGKGEMSSVYLAQHVRMKRRCAIKVLPAHKVRETSYLGRFHREAEAVAQLDHPNIVRAYDVDVEEEGGAEIHYLVMEYVVGKSLEKTVNENGPLSVIAAADTIRQAASGVAHAHAAGLVHRDIKPGNLLIDKTGVVKLLDLGLARFFKDPDRESLTIKHDEKVLGTADYLAPEQAVDSHSVDERADIYALGCTLFFALTGRPPFVEGTLVQRLLAHQTQTPPAISEFRDNCPDELTKIIHKMMAKEPNDRYQSASEVEQALGRFLVEHADRAWREKNLEVVAAVRGVDSLLAVQTPSATNPSPENAASPSPQSAETVDKPAIPAAAVQTPTREEKPAAPAKERTATKPLTLAEPPLQRRDIPATTPVTRSNAVAAQQSSKGTSPTREASGSWWDRADKQIVAIVALLAISMTFVASVVFTAQAVDDTLTPVETDVQETETPTEQSGLDQLSPILNQPEPANSNAFGVEGTTVAPRATAPVPLTGN